MSPEAALELFNTSTFRHWTFKKSCYGDYHEYVPNRNLQIYQGKTEHDHHLLFDGTIVSVLDSEIVFNKVTRPAPANPELLGVLRQIRDSLQVIAQNTRPK